jgi:hypothetical protein
MGCPFSLAGRIVETWNRNKKNIQFLIDGNNWIQTNLKTKLRPIKSSLYNRKIILTNEI